MQRWGCAGGYRRRLREERFPWHPERVRRALLLARFPMGGLQARSTHLEADTQGTHRESAMMSFCVGIMRICGRFCLPFVLVIEKDWGVGGALT